MKKNYLLLLLFHCVGIAGIHAQNATMVTGRDVNGTGGNVSYSIGQIACSSPSSSDGTVLQGVQQPYEIFVGIEEIQGIVLELNVYPNPVEEDLILTVTNLSLENLSVNIFDINGRLLLFEKLNSEKTNLKTETFANGSYLLSVSNTSGVLKTFTFIKNK